KAAGAQHLPRLNGHRRSPKKTHTETGNYRLPNKEQPICLGPALTAPGVRTLRGSLTISWASPAGASPAPSLMSTATPRACAAGGIAPFSCLGMQPHLQGGPHFGSPQQPKWADYTAKLVVRGGVEPPTFRFSGGRSYRLSYLTMPGHSPA